MQNCVLFSVGRESLALTDTVRKPGPKERSLRTLSLEQWSQTGTVAFSQGGLALSAGISGCHNVEVLLASNG